MPDTWAPVAAALARAGQAGRTVEAWLRDDDAVTVTPALDRLTALVRRHKVPVLLAVIPRDADRALAQHVDAEPLLTPTQHGFAHLNHAAAGERACEIGGARPLAAVLDDLERGRDRLRTLFGDRAADILVPPWNRITPPVVPQLPRLGFGGLSTFANAHAGAGGLAVVNSTLDVIDWRGSRRCHPAGKLVARLAALIDEGRPIGLLAHHLVHDDAAWTFLDEALGHLRASPQARLVPVDALRSPPG